MDPQHSQKEERFQDKENLGVTLYQLRCVRRSFFCGTRLNFQLGCFIKSENDTFYIQSAQKIKLKKKKKAEVEVFLLAKSEITKHPRRR